MEGIFKKINSNKGMTHGDIFPLLYKAGIKTLKFPITSIFNKVAKTGIWPDRWMRENSFIRKKVPSPKSLDDVHAISKSPLLCGQFEKFMVKWLLDVIEPQLDWAQYGAQKGCGVLHLIIELLTFIHYNIDIRNR